MPTEDNPSAPDGATLTVTGLPDDGEIAERAWALANGAKAWAWSGMYESDTLPEDHVFLRGALALIHMLEASEAMKQAPLLVALLASSFTVDDNDQPMRAKLLSMPLDDPSRFLAEAVRNNRLLLGMPPQLNLVEDDS